MTSKGGDEQDDAERGAGTLRPARSIPPGLDSIGQPGDEPPLTLGLPVVQLLLPGEEAVALDESPPWSDAEPRLALEISAPDAWASDRGARRAPTPAPRAPLRPTRQIRVPRAPSVPPPPGHGHALDLIDRSKPSSQHLDMSGEMNERFALGDFTGALFVAELLLGRDPENSVALACAAASRERLEHLYSSRIGALTRVPIVSVRENDIRWLGLDHRAGFLLSRIDGAATLEEVLDISGMPRLEALKTFVELYEAGAIRFGR